MNVIVQQSTTRRKMWFLVQCTKYAFSYHKKLTMILISGNFMFSLQTVLEQRFQTYLKHKWTSKYLIKVNKSLVINY